MSFNHPQHLAHDGLTLKDFMPPADGVTTDSDGKAHAGSPLAEGVTPATKDAIVAALRGVHDPELPVNIYDLGLIYVLRPERNGDVSIKMTLTAPACPVAGQMPGQVASAVAQVEGVGEVVVELVWDPPWTTAMMSEDAKLALDIF